MVKTKRVIGMALAVVFTTMSMMTMPAQAATKKKVTAKKVVVVPAKVTTVDGPADEYQPGDPVEVTVKAANTSAKVQYRVSMVNAGKRVELYSAKTKFFGAAKSGKVASTFTLKAFGVGTAAMVVYAKAVGSTKIYDSAVSYKFVVQPRPTEEPTEEPTEAPTEAPTVAPTAAPTTAPSVEPTAAPSVAPTAAPAATKAEVKLSSAKGFKVTFDGVVADTSKVTFEVKRETTPLTVTATWDADKKVATVENAAKLPQGNYTIVVKIDGKEVANTTSKIEQEKVAKITILSDTLSVVTETVGNANVQRGYATYKVENQYGEDITNNSIASNINWQCGIGTATAQKGLITIEPIGSVNLVSFSTMTLTAIEQSAAVTSSSTLKVSAAIGTISEMNLVGLKDNGGKSLVAGNSGDVFYADFAAKDMSGNATTSYKLIKSGLLLNTLNNEKSYLTTTSPYVTAKLVQDPADSTKAAIEVRVVEGCEQYVNMDIPVTISAVTYTGKTSTINVTLKKASALNKFTLLAPSYDIATGETKEIPFEAQDQNGNAITSYAKLKAVNLTNARLEPQVDGTAKVYFTAPGIKGTSTLTASTPTGNFSSLNIYVQDAAKATSVTVSTSGLKSFMQKDAYQHLDFGVLYGGLSVKDQYDRSYNMLKYTNGTTNVNKYFVQLRTTDASKIAFEITDPNDPNKVKKLIVNTLDVYGNIVSNIKAIGIGTANVQAVLIEKATGTEIDSKTITLTVVNNDDIVAYDITTEDPILAVYSKDYIAAGSAPSRIADNHYTGPTVSGKLASGSLVKLADATFVDEFIDNTTYFFNDGNYLGNASGIFATTLPSTTAEASTKYTAMLRDASGKLVAVSSVIKSKNEAITAQSVDASISSYDTRVTRDGDTVSMTTSAATALNGKTILRYDANGSYSNRTSLFYFYAKDQLGYKSAEIKTVEVSSKSFKNATVNFTVTNGIVTITNPALIQAGDYVVLSAYSNNGYSRSIKILFTLD